MMGICTNHCLCCGETESHTGCVLGYRCGCMDFERRYCAVCQKCEKHCRCPKREIVTDWWMASRIHLDRIIEKLRKEGKIKDGDPILARHPRRQEARN
jgi:hypothetical protein